MTLKILAIALLATSVLSNAQEILTHQWVSSVGSIESENGRSVVADAAGNVYATGYFRNTADFDPGPGVATLTSFGGIDAFVVKYDPNGELVWARQLGGTSTETGDNITIDLDGNIIVAGPVGTNGDYDPGPGTFILSGPSGGYDVYVLKLTADGDFVWAKQIGGTGSMEILTVAVDSNNDIVFGGSFTNTIDFDPSAVVSNVTSVSASYDAYAAKWDNSGNFLWVKSFGSTGIDRSYDLTLAPNDDVCIVGEFRLTVDFDPGAGVFNLTSEGGSDAFAVRLSWAGNLVFAKGYGGTTDQQGTCASANINGDLIIGGFVYTTGDVDPGAGTYLISGVSAEPYVMCLDQTGTFKWAKDLHGPNFEYVYEIETDAAGNIGFVGNFSDSLYVPFGGPAFYYYSMGSNDYYLNMLDSSGNYLQSYLVNGEGAEEIAEVKNKGSSWYLIGDFQYITDFDASPAIDIITPVGNFDAFIQKLKICPSFAGTILASTDTSTCGLVLSLATDMPFDDYLWSTSDTTAITDIIASGTYSVIVTGASGCDGHDTIDVSINGTTSAFSVGVCDDYTMPSGDETYDVAGTYLDTIPNTAGCDSIMTITVSLLGTSASTFVTVCESYTVPSGDESYTIEGTYLDTIVNAAGCDSVITINLSILNSSTATLPVTECGEYTVPSGDETYFVSGVYSDTISNSVGCDSVITINLTLTELEVIDLGADTTVCEGGYLMDAGTFYDQYIWSSGALGPVYTALESGEYIVVGYVNGCSQSDTITVALVDCLMMNEVIRKRWEIYPNPGNGTYFIAGNTKAIESVLIFDLRGDKVFHKVLNGENNFEFDAAPGTYLVRFISEGGLSSPVKLVRN